jgi:fibroblast growth factor receptor substrate 2
MGCVYSQPRHSRSSANNSSIADNPRIFHVCNVDDRGTEVNFGKIEITDNDLALHQKGKNSIYWSLRSLRRYGFDAELFSFECGRRCPTGPGIYAFKCTNAEQLFNTLQEAIQQCSNTQYPIFGGGPVIGSETNHLNQTNTTPPEVGPRYPLRPNAPHLYSNDIHEYINSPFYVNTPAIIQHNNTSNPSQSQPLPTTRSDVNTNYAKLDDLVRFYVNIKTPAAMSSLSHPLQQNNTGVQQTNESHSAPHSPTSTSADPVNYIMLDLDQSNTSGQPTIVTTAPATPISKTPTMDYPVTNTSSSSTPPPTPTSASPPQPYAQIDFAKTVALSNSAANHRKM